MQKTALKLYKQTVFLITVFLIVSLLSFLSLWPALVFFGLLFLSLLILISHHRDISIPFIAPFLGRQYFRTKFRIMEIKNKHLTDNISSIHMEPLISEQHLDFAGRAILFLNQIYLVLVYYLVIMFHESEECFDLVREEFCLLNKHIHFFDHKKNEKINLEAVSCSLDKNLEVNPLILEILHEKFFILHQHKQGKLKTMSASGIILLILAIIVSTLVLNFISSNPENIQTASAISADSAAPENGGNLKIISSSLEIISETEAALKWMTNLEADSIVHYLPYSHGVLATNEVRVRSDDNLVMEHRIMIDNLKPGTLYYIELESKDAKGDIATKRIRRFFEAR